MFLLSFAGITCLTRQPSEFMQQNEVALDLFEASVKEAVAIAAADG